MERIRAIIEQLEESKRLILIGNIPHFRMAFVLLDNAVEILMQRRLEDLPEHNKMLRKLISKAQETFPLEEYKKWQAEFKISVMDVKQEGAIFRFFDEKTKFLSEDKKYIKKDVVAVLRSLHRYRNELYHREIIRKDTIRASAILLFEITCDLLSQLPSTSYTSIGSEEDTPYWQDFFNKYRAKTGAELCHARIAQVSKQLKRDLSISHEDLASALKNSLQVRLNLIIKDIKCVKDNLKITSNEKALKFAQFCYNNQESVDFNYIDKALECFQARFTLRNLKECEDRIKKLDVLKNKLTLFHAFSNIENELEEIGIQTDYLVIEIDRAVQFAIDLARGK